MMSGISSLSASSLSEMRQQMFNKIDTDSSGSLDKAEMAALIEENTSSLVNSLFSNQDTDQDDLISRIEFDSGMAKLEQELKNGDGLSGASGVSAPPPPPEEVFDTADTNEDGVVSKDELAAVMGERGNIDELFGRVDTDGDGSITRAEDEAFRETMADRAEQGSASGTGTTAELGQGWQSRMLSSLLQGLAATSGATGESTSLYA